MIISDKTFLVDNQLFLMYYSRMTRLVFFFPIVLIPLTLLITKNSNRRDDITLLVSAFAVFVILALRSFNLGVDVPGYHAVFNEFKNISFKDFISGNYPKVSMEIGYLGLYWVAMKVFGNFRAILVIQGLLCASADVFLVKKYSTSPSMAMFILLCVGMIDFPIDIIRQSFSLAILIFSLPQIENKHPIRFILFVILASLFHRTALAFIIVFPLSLIKPSRKNLIIFSALSAVLFIATPFLFKTVGVKIMALFGRSYSMEESEMREMIFVIAALAAFLILNTDFSSIIPRKYSFVTWPFMLSLPFLIISIYVPIMTRVAMFLFFPFVSTVVPNCLEYGTIITYKNKWATIGIYICFAAYYVFRMWGSYLVPYIPFWA